MMIDKQIYTPEECADLFPFLDTLEIEYHKPYKRFNQIVKVPRGQEQRPQKKGSASY